ncbi:MAG: hypothetical protein H8D67_03065 [Deltaproteobacteria bacterium]|nr:hypothetical protein [Deltaproteobacteria bacterium]
MALYTPKAVVLNWFRYDVSFSIELIESFVHGIEHQAQESIDRYREQKETHFVEEVPEENHARIVKVHQELDDETWDLEGIFSDYFPSLQRRSALLTAFAYFEHELDKLCYRYRSEKSFKLALSDLRGKGIDRATSYLEKVAEIDVFKASKEWNHIKKIQKIRNVIVHQDGKLFDSQGNPIKTALEYINQMDSLSGDNELVIHEGFLEYVVTTFKEYFQLLSKSIEAAEGA